MLRPTPALSTPSSLPHQDPESTVSKLPQAFPKCQLSPSGTRGPNPASHRALAPFPGKTPLSLKQRGYHKRSPKSASSPPPCGGQCGRKARRPRETCRAGPERPPPPRTSPGQPGHRSCHHVSRGQVHPAHTDLGLRFPTGLGKGPLEVASASHLHTPALHTLALGPWRALQRGPGLGRGCTDSVLTAHGDNRPHPCQGPHGGSAHPAPQFHTRGQVQPALARGFTQTTGR